MLPLTWAVFGLRKKGGDAITKTVRILPTSVQDPNSWSQTEMVRALRGSSTQG